MNSEATAEAMTVESLRRLRKAEESGGKRYVLHQPLGAGGWATARRTSTSLLAALVGTSSLMADSVT